MLEFVWRCEIFRLHTCSKLLVFFILFLLIFFFAFFFFGTYSKNYETAASSQSILRQFVLGLGGCKTVGCVEIINVEYGKAATVLILLVLYS